MTDDADRVAFLRWALPRMRLCWDGFRRSGGRSAGGSTRDVYRLSRRGP